MTCRGNVEFWDQTVGCPECGMELWNYSGKLANETYLAYEDRFYQDHPFTFEAAHDSGDEDPKAWEPGELPLIWYVPPPYFRGKGGYMKRGG